MGRRYSPYGTTGSAKTTTRFSSGPNPDWSSWRANLSMPRPGGGGWKTGNWSNCACRPPGPCSWRRRRDLSAPFHKYGCIRAPLHPLPLCCTPCAVLLRVRLSRAPRWRGASTLSVRHRIYEAEHLGMATPVDLRSDTVTLPSPGMRKAMARARVGDSQRGEDPSVLALEEYAAFRFGKEAGLFVPSGTMGNLVSVSAWTRPGDIVDRKSTRLN